VLVALPDVPEPGTSSSGDKYWNKAELANNRLLLDTLPDQLSVIERASKALQVVLTATSGAERLARLNLARSLPAPLYTLFQQLQQYVDQSSHVTSHAGVTVIIISDKVMPLEQQVSLPLPVPDVLNGSSLASSSASPTTVSTSQQNNVTLFSFNLIIHVLAG
jgi:hypothetical protein